MLRLEFTVKFKRDYKRMKKRGADFTRLRSGLEMLQTREPLPSSMCDHDLTGPYKGHRECHIAPDWLLIYRIDDTALVLTAVRTGSHTDLLGM